MRTHITAIIISVIIFSVLIAGCASNAPPTTTVNPPTTTVNPPTTTVNPSPLLATKDPSQMALSLSDLPQGYVIKERSERTTSDVDSKALALGWKKGYTVTFLHQGSTILDVTRIQQGISIYPIDKINDVMFTIQDSALKLSNETIKVEKLSDPKIGDSSQAFRITEGNLRYYSISFTKYDVFEELSMTGTTTDYETLKDLANIAVAKIG